MGIALASWLVLRWVKRWVKHRLCNLVLQLGACRIFGKRPLNHQYNKPPLKAQTVRFWR